MSATSNENYNRFVNHMEWERENWEPAGTCRPLPVIFPTLTGVLVATLGCSAGLAGLSP